MMGKVYHLLEKSFEISELVNILVVFGGIQLVWVQHSQMVKEENLSTLKYTEHARNRHNKPTVRKLVI